MTGGGSVKKNVVISNENNNKHIYSFVKQSKTGPFLQSYLHINLQRLEQKYYPERLKLTKVQTLPGGVGD